MEKGENLDQVLLEQGYFGPSFDSTAYVYIYIYTYIYYTDIHVYKRESEREGKPVWERRAKENERKHQVLKKGSKREK